MNLGVVRCLGARIQTDQDQSQQVKEIQLYFRFMVASSNCFAALHKANMWLALDVFTFLHIIMNLALVIINWSVVIFTLSVGRNRGTFS